MRYNTVLFDADGTILDFEKSEREALLEVLGNVGIDADNQAVAAYSQINDRLWKMLERKEIEREVLSYRRFELLAEHLGCDFDAKQMSKNYISTIAEKGYLLQGARELLDKLYGKVRMYVVTNGTESVQRGRHAKTGIEKYFDGIFISQVIGYNKPDERFFEHVAQSVPNFDKATTIVVGDSLSSDIKGGNNFDIDTCWYAPHTDAVATVATPTDTAHTYDEIYKIIVG